MSDLRRELFIQRMCKESQENLHVQIVMDHMLFLIKGVDVVIQITQPQVCYPNPKQDMLDLKSGMCRKVSQAAKNILQFDITGKDLFEALGPLSAPAPPPQTLHIHDHQS